MFQENCLKDKNFFITGGGSGLGYAMAERFAGLGANIAICGRTEEKLAQAADKLRKFGTKVLSHQADVRDYAVVEAMFKKTTDQWGHIDGLINNAAGNFLCPSEDLSPNGFKTIIDIVLNGTFNCSQVFGKYLIENKKKGSILNIVTTYTQTGSAFVLPSACAKAGVYALTNTLAYEWACYGIRVNAIAPGPFPTEGAWTRLMPDAAVEKQYLKQNPMERYGEKQELSNLAVFLMSDLAPYINGECVTIDGGKHLQSGEFNFLAQLMPRGELKKIFSKMRPSR